MNVLFVTFKRLSIGTGELRSVSILRALADAGNQVDVIAAGVDLEAHPHVQVIAGDRSGRSSQRRLKQALRRALKTKSYQVVHAVDHAALYAVRKIRPKRTRLVYQASRCFTGTHGIPPSWYWKLFPNCCRRRERKILRRAALVISSCDELSADLRKLSVDPRLIEVKDVPAQPLFPRRDRDVRFLAREFPGGFAFLVVYCVLPGNRGELRTLLLAARKVVDKIPRAAFIFKGLAAEEGKALAANLEIEERCLFVSDDETERFLSALSFANAALFVPRPGARYPQPEILTVLNSPGLVVAIQERAYSPMLTERNSLQVDFTANSIAEGLLRAVQEPLLAFGIVAEAQQQIADGYSFSSFKHKVRMAYHDLTAAN